MKKLLSIVTAVAALGAAAAVAPDAGAQTATREFEGTVVSVDRDARTFRLRDHDGRGTVTIRVTSRTRYERVAGFAGLKAGARNIESTVRRSGDRWVALEVERSGRDDDDRGGSGRDHPEDD